MLATEKSIIDRFASELKDDVMPYDTLPHLPCLTEDDREQIRYKQEREGPRAAVPILLGQLKRRPNGFEQLLTALECTGCKHLKKSLHDATKESPKVAVTTPTEASPSPPPLNLKLPATPSQETDCSEFPTSPSQETDCSEFPTSPSQETDCSELSPTPLQGTEHSEPPTTPRSQESDDREYDILVCCSLKDREVAFELRKVMLDEFHLRVCIDELDFVPGNAISDNICDFIRCSKAIVFLLTPDFLEKKWARWEMQQATLDLLSNRSTKKIVPVILRKCDVPQELQPYTPLNFQQLESGATITTEDWKRLAAAVHGQRLAGSSIMGKLSKLFGKKSPN